MKLLKLVLKMYSLYCVYTAFWLKNLYNNICNYVQVMVSFHCVIYDIYYYIVYNIEVSLKDR